jgi:ABC-type transport system involved in multi-copper enzyme maturation permease subunit
MLAIIKKRAPLYISHLVTYSLLGVLQIVSPRPEKFFILGLFVAVWITSSVLWSERDESEALLRTLPVTHREIVTTKFLLALTAMAVYWGIMFTAALRLGAEIGSLSPGLVFISVSWSIALVLAGLWYIAIWFFGMRPMIPIMLVFIVGFCAIGVALLSQTSRGLTVAPHQLTVLGAFVDVPGYVAVIAVALALLAYYGLLQVAVRVRTVSDA